LSLKGKSLYLTEINNKQFGKPGKFERIQTPVVFYFGKVAQSQSAKLENATFLSGRVNSGIHGLIQCAFNLRLEQKSNR